MKISTYISTIDSLFWQTTLEATIRQAVLFSDEIIVVNSEHSTDGSLELLDELHSEYPNVIRLYKFKEDYSKGWDTVAEKKDFALKKCTGDYCILQDDDEMIHEKYVDEIRGLPEKYPNVLGFRFNVYHFYRSYFRYQNKEGWYKKKIYMVKNIPRISHGRVGTDPDNFVYNSNNGNVPLDWLSEMILGIVNTNVVVYHYGWCRNDAVLLFKKYFQEIQWWGSDYWSRNGHKFPYWLDDPGTLSEFKGAHPKYMIPLVNSEKKFNTKHIKDFENRNFEIKFGNEERKFGSNKTKSS